MIFLKKILVESSFRTSNGSVIKRFRNNVGKHIGGQLYFHKNYAAEIVPSTIWKRSISELKKSYPNFTFNTVMWDVKKNIIRFDESPDFDSAREPHVGNYVTIDITGKNAPKAGQSNNIWHHKWLWVKDDYTGFDVDKSKNWSKIWLSKLKEPAKGSDPTWTSQLKQHGLNESVTMETSELKFKSALNFLMKMVKNGPFNGNVFLAGGAVRDMELGKIPKDLDITVIGSINGGLEFAIWIAKQMGNYKGPSTPFPTPPPNVEVDSRGYPESSEDPVALSNYLEKYENYFKQFSNPVIFPKFGTAKINLTGTHEGVSLDGVELEAVASRKEVYTPGSRKPKVFPGTLMDDVMRRDFTTNSLMLDLSTGIVYDLTGHGKEDIKAGVLRTTSNPEIIFREDPLRMMRAVRFMVQKGWKIDAETEESIRKNAEWLKHISKERIRDELNKMLVTANPEIAIRKLRDLGMLPYISPELQTAHGMTQNVHHSEDVFDHTMSVLKGTNPHLINRLMALYHDIGKVVTRSETPTGVHFYGHEDAGADMVEKILHNLKYPVEIINAVKLGVKNHMRLKQGGDTAVKLSDKTLRKFKMEMGDTLEHVLDVIHADNIAHASASAMPNQIENVRKRLATLDIQVKKPTLPINGNDIISLGIPAGKQVGQIMAAITDAWFENPNISREDAIAIAKSMI